LEILEQLGIDYRLIIVNILGFLILVWILKKFLYGPITQMIANRGEEIRSTYETAESEKATMEQLRKDYEKRLENIESEAHEKIQAAIKEAHGIRDEIIADARTRSEDILKRGEEELGREREKTVAALRDDVADLVVSASSNLLERSMDDAAHRKLIDDFISSVGKTQ
jgi:F-type H+-transporting ATPase subunit b